MKNMLLRISLSCFVCISLSLLVSCDPRQDVPTNIGTRHGSDNMVVRTSADVIMREDAEEIFYNLDVGKYEDEGIHCEPAASPDNGYLVGEDTKVGSVVYVKCEKGFWLSGPVIVACTVDNGGARWTPDSERTCIRGQTFFEEDNVLEPSDETNDVIPARRNEEFSPDIERLPPFIHRNHKWNPSLRQLIQRQKEDVEDKERGLDRLRQEQEDQLPTLCLAKPEVGPCRGTFRRYYFNKDTMECKKFYYGGCGGNTNNFESISDCMSHCKGHTISGDVDGHY